MYFVHAVSPPGNEGSMSIAKKPTNDSFTPVSGTSTSSTTTGGGNLIFIFFTFGGRAMVSVVNGGGVSIKAFSFGGGGNSTTPAVVIVRSFCPNPQPLSSITPKAITAVEAHLCHRGCCGKILILSAS